MSVDTNQADTQKAVSRVASEDDDSLPVQGDDAEEMSAQEQRYADRLDQNRAIKKRIGRITRKYDQQLAEQEARHQRQIGDLNEKLNSLQARRQNDGASASEAEHERKMAKLQSDLEKAMEEGRSAEVARLNREIAREESQFWQAQTKAAMGEAGDRSEKPERQSTNGDNSRTPAQQRRPSRAGIAFTEANDWWDDEDFYVEKAAANTIFARLVEEEGADPEDPQTYARVAKRLQKKFSHLEIVVPGSRRGRDDGDDEDDDDLDDDDSDTRRGARRIAAGAAVQSSHRRDGALPSRRRGEMQLTEADFKTMRTIGMNPDNNEHCMQFALGKKEADDQERARR